MTLTWVFVLAVPTCHYHRCRVPIPNCLLASSGPAFVPGAQSGCGLGTEGRGVAAASQALPTGSLVQHPRHTGRAEAGEQRAQCPGSKDAAACHWSHFLLRPRLTPAAPSCHKKTPESCCSQWFGCRLRTHLSLGLGGGLFLEAAGPLHPVLVSWPRGLAITCPRQGTG